MPHLSITSWLGGILPLCAALALPSAAGAQSRRIVETALDLRGRFEADVASTDENGLERDDRARLRTRARAEIRLAPAPGVLFAVRVRSGLRSSQQSPHLTFADLTDGPTDPVEGSVDRYYGEVSWSRYRVWGGRNEFPFWSFHDLFWDRDATLVGGFAESRWRSRGGGSLEVRAGYFGLPDGAVEIGGRMAAAQIVATRARKPWTLTATAGYFAFHGADRTTYLQDGNGTRDYDIGVASIQVERGVEWAGVQFARVGADVVHNFHEYGVTTPDQVAAANLDERTGLVLGAVVGGRQSSRPLWEGGYTFARLEKLAVNASYASDDWVRWGSGGQADASNLVGHEFTARWWFTRGLDLHARVFVVDSITTVQDGTRFRADLNWRLTSGWLAR